MISDVYRFILEVRPLLKTLDLTGCPCLTRGLARDLRNHSTNCPITGIFKYTRINK